MKKLIMVGLILCFNMMLFAQTTEVVEINPRPWNGWWWPYNYGELINGYKRRGHPAPFEKYDFAFNQEYKATDWEKTYHYTPDASSFWWGHCNGWAAAAILEPEPVNAISYNSVVFFVGDLKGLLTECYQGAIGPFYGTRYNGEYASYPDGITAEQAFNDINPLEFQNVLEMYLKDNELPILIDAAPDASIWTYPVYKYEKSVYTDGNVQHVTLTVYCATDQYAGINPDDINDYIHSYVKTYTYDIHLNESGEPESAEWTGDSVNDHPDFAWYPETIESRNPYIELNKVHFLLENYTYTFEDDEFEPNDSFEESMEIDCNRIYRLINNDYFNFFVEPGEEIDFKLWVNYYNADLIPLIYDENKVEVSSLRENLEGLTNIKSYDWEYKNDELNKKKFYIFIPSVENFQDNYVFNVTNINNTAIIPHTLDTFFWDNFIIGGMIPYVEEQGGNQIRIDFGKGYFVGNKDTESFLLKKQIVNLTPAFVEINIGGQSNFPDWVKINTFNKGIKLLSFYQSQGDGSMSYLVNVNPAKNFILSHVPPESNYWWFGLILLNPSHFKSMNVFYKLYGYNREIIKEGTIHLNKSEKKVGLFEDFFKDISMEQVSYIEFYSDSDFVASSLFGTKSHRELAFVPADSDFLKGGESFYVPMGLLETINRGNNDRWIGLVLLNPKNEGYCPVRFKFLLKNNTSIETIKYIAGNEKFVSTIRELIPPNINYDDLKRIELTIYEDEHSYKNTKLSGFILCGSHDEGKLSSFYLTPLSDFISVYYPILKNHNLSTNFFVSNEKPYAVTFKVEGLNSSGEVIAQQNLSLERFEVKQFNLSSLFNNFQEIVTIHVQASKLICPFMVYENDDLGYFEILGPILRED